MADSTQTDDSTVTDAAPTEHDPAAMADALKKANAEAKKYRLEAKANADAIEALRLESMTESEKTVTQAVESARTETRRDVLREVGGQLVDAQVRVAAAGRPIDVDALLEGVDRMRYIDDTGAVDVKGISAWVDRIAPAATAPVTPRLDFGQGQRGQPPVADDAAVFARFIDGQLNS